MKRFLKNILTQFFLFWNKYIYLYRTYNLLALQKYIESNEEGNQQFMTVFKANINQVFLDKPYLLSQGYPHIDRVVAVAHFLKVPMNGLVVDVGGFDGNVAIKFANALPKSQVYTFEPIKKHFEQLKQNTSVYPTIKAFNIGLGETTEELQINKLSNDSSSSLLEVSSNIGNDFFSTNLAPKAVEMISVKRLDDILLENTSSISILKMDVQGFELQVLKGGIQTLKKVYLIILEMQNHEFYVGAPMYYELDEFLRNQGFRLFDLMPSIRDEMKLYEWDAIYVNSVLV